MKLKHSELYGKEESLLYNSFFLVTNLIQYTLKTNYYPVLIALLGFSILLNIFLYRDTKQQLAYYKEINNGITFVWNDDEESIPVDGTPIILEYTDENTVYIGLIEYQSPEYQFIVTDDSVSVSNFGKPVGTIKLEGQLKQLIDQDNE